jgi:hypothetical protein
MVVVEGSEMKEFKLNANSQFAPIVSETVDYAPDPPPAPPTAQMPADGSDSSTDNEPILTEPTAVDDGLGSITESPNL